MEIRLRSGGPPASGEQLDNVIAELNLQLKIPMHRFLRAQVLHNLGAALGTRFQTTQYHSDLDGSIDAFRGSFEVSRKFFARKMMPGLHFAVCSGLGKSLLNRYELANHIEDLEEAILLLRKATKNKSVEEPMRAVAFVNLGQCLRRRYNHLGKVRDLDECISILQKTYSLHNDSAHIEIPAALGMALWDRWRVHCRTEDASAAIDYFREDLSIASRDERRYLAACANLGGCLIDRALYLDRAEDLLEAIDILEPGATSILSSDNLLCKTNLATALLQRFELENEEADLNRAGLLLKECLGFKRSPEVLYQWGLTLRARFGLTSDPGDLEGSVAALREAINALNKNNSFLPLVEAGLAGSLRELCLLGGRREGLEEVLSLCEKASSSIVRLLIPGFRSLHAITLSDRYKSGGDVSFLDKAISLQKDELEQLPPNSVHIPVFNANCGSALYERFRARKRRSDLDKAIEFMGRVAAGRNQRLLGGNALNLGACLHERYLLDKRLEDLEVAHDMLGQALELLTDHQYQVLIFSRLSAVMRSDYLRTGSQASLKEAEDYAARALGTLDGLIVLASAQQIVGHQIRWDDVYSQAVETYLVGKRNLEAMACVESSKARLLSSMLTRQELIEPPGIPKNLVQKERRLAQRLASMDAHELAQIPSASSVVKPSTPKRTELLNELRAAWRAIEQIGAVAKDYVDIRKPKQFLPVECEEFLSGLEVGTSVLSVYVNEQKTRLLLCNGGEAAEVVVMEVPISRSDWTNTVNQLQREIYGANEPGMAETWPNQLRDDLGVVGDFLEKVETLFVCPHGPSHLIPWPWLGRLLGWRVSVATAPSLQVLARLKRSSAFEKASALVVGNPVVEHSIRSSLPSEFHQSLPFAAEEAVAVANKLGVEPLESCTVTKETVMERLGNACVAHFATHAFFNPDSPLDSGVVLSDGVLSARDLLTAGVRMPDFVTLSACQTGLNVPLGGDELAGMNAAMFYAGARCVLSSLWSVDDRATRDLMVEFYNSQSIGAASLRTAMERVVRIDEPEIERTYLCGGFTLAGVDEISMAHLSK